MSELDDALEKISAAEDMLPGLGVPALLRALEVSRRQRQVLTRYVIDALHDDPCLSFPTSHELDAEVLAALKGESDE